jgi:hemoglobin-like flavoprotein
LLLEKIMLKIADKRNINEMAKHYLSVCIPGLGCGADRASSHKVAFHRSGVVCRPGGEVIMGPSDLSALRNFFNVIEPRMPEVVAAMYNRVFEAAPWAKPLFKGNLQDQQRRYMHMLQTMVKLTRSSHLWPIGAFTGKASLPILDQLGTIHADVGIKREHFDLMKSILSQCCKEIGGEAFNPRVEKALGFIFDVVANSLTKSSDVCEEERMRKNSLPASSDELPAGDFNAFFNNEALLTELLEAQTLH